MEKSSKEKYRFTTAKPSNIPKPTLDKNLTICVRHFCSLLASFGRCQLPDRCPGGRGVITDLIVGIITIINLSNSILNPFVFVLRIPEFGQALSLCFSRRQAEVNRPRMEGRENMAAVLTPVQHEITTLQPDSSQVQQTFEQETIDTKL